MPNRPSWRLTAYGIAFAGALFCDLLLHPVQGISIVALLGAIGVAATLIRVTTALRLPTGLAVWTALLPLGLDRAILPIATSVRPAAEVVHGLTLWPICLMAVFGSRVLALSTRSNYLARWDDPVRAPVAVAEQSLGAALAFGFALTIALLALVPIDGAGSDRPQGILVAALRGTTVIHVLIVYAACVVATLVADGFALLAADWRTLVLARRGIRMAQGDRARIDAAVDRLPNTRIGLLFKTELGRDGADDWAAHQQFREASRLFIRRSLTLLPLLGFLGTVVGLSAAVADLPFGTGGVQSGDLGASLRGLAVKFETTFLGLVGSAVLGAVLSLLERLEAETAAGVLQIVGRVTAAPTARGRAGP
ncbi:hypothetical protein [Methyloraptor flagellatus]|uniref:MotA/TolQ/ExbB proton channel domain-containing protein n=1 Tax=Methyloraptor flagellatus TaxID=3162530 RepID=A0AAU7X7I7_9HYPH